MDEKLKPFTPNATCPKCGGGEVSVWYRSRKSALEEASRFRAPDWIPHQEYMRRTCATCGCEWPEAPMDAESGP